MCAAKIIMCAWLKMAKCLKNPYVFEAKSPNTCRFQTSTLQGASFRGSPDKVPHHPKQSAWRLWKPGNIWDFTMKKNIYIYILMGSMSPYIDHENSIHGSYSNWTSLSEISGGFDQESNEHKPPVFPAMTRMTLDMHGARCTKLSQLWPLTDIHGIRWD